MIEKHKPEVEMKIVHEIVNKVVMLYEGNIIFDTRPVHLNTLTNNTQTIHPKKRVY